jgi:hypothetical protein
LAADDVEKIHRIKLRALLGGKPTSQETPSSRFRGVPPPKDPVKFPERAGPRRARRPANKADQKVHRCCFV